MTTEKTLRFEGEQVDVEWDGSLCIHIAECGQAEGDLFVTGRKPWCIPDLDSAEAVAEVCRRCPSGALSYYAKAGDQEQAPAGNSIRVSYNGPLFVHGDLELGEVQQRKPGTRFRAALCRCGHSRNKPFCDNSHRNAGFEDYGAIGATGSGTSEIGGRLKFSPAANGPLLISGPVTLYASSGRAAWHGDKAALCRCGASANKPFCDGSHQRVGFRSDSSG